MGQLITLMVVKLYNSVLFFLLYCQLKQMVGEKKITKNFEYDLPSELVLTFLSEVSLMHQRKKFNCITISHLSWLSNSLWRYN